MAELPVELIYIILANITDYKSMVNLALTSRLYYATAIPVILAEESRYVRHVMMPGKHLSIFEFPDQHSRLPPAGLDSPAGPFTGTIRMIDFVPWQDFKYLCCIGRLVRRAKHLERITMDVLEGSDRSWLTAYINICVGRPGVAFTLNGGDGVISITDIDESMGPKAIGRPKLSFNRPVYLSDIPSSPTIKRNSFSGFCQQLKSTATLRSHQAGSQSYSDGSGLIAPRISELELVNQYLFSSRLAPVVRTLAGSEHITSFTFVNARDYNNNSAYTTTFNVNNDGVTSPRAVFASLSFPSLTRLSIAHILLPTSALIHFLARHQLITDLYLDLLYPFLFQHHISLKSSLTEWRIPTSPPDRFLPNIARLGGTAYWVLPFVRWRQLKDRDGGDAGHLSTLQGLELRTESEPWKPIRSPTWTLPHHSWETTDLNAFYDVLFCANPPSQGSSASSWKVSFSRPSKRPHPETRTCIRSLTFETLSCIHFIDWLKREAAKRQAWPVLSDNGGAGIRELIIPERETFMALKTREDLLNAVGQWCPELAREIEMNQPARSRNADAGRDAHAGLYSPWPVEDTEVEDEEGFTQYLLERVIWHTFPSLQTLQIGMDKKHYPPAQRIYRPVRF